MATLRQAASGQLCPNCGSDRVTVQQRKYDPKRGRFLQDNSAGNRLWAVLVWSVGMLLLDGAVPYFLGSNSAVSQAVPFWVPFALGLAVLVVLSARQEWRNTTASQVSSYRCENCGHGWDVLNGKPQ